MALDKRQRDKRWRYLRETGRPSMVPIEPVAKHLKALHARGMACTAMARQSGVAAHLITEAMNGMRSDGSIPRSMTRTNAEKLLAVKFEPPEGHKCGARISPIPYVRMVQALMALGFSSTCIANQMGDEWESSVYQIASGQRGSLLATTARKIEAIYYKLRDANPLDYGMRPSSIGLAKSASRKKKWAPPHCWDEETIYDPDAIPEWTGACGTPEGYRLHRRYGIPLCGNCSRG